MDWDAIYNFLHIKEFIYYISSSQIQDALFPVKIVFIACAVFFLVFVIYFMIKSSWLQNTFLEDVTEFFSWKAAGQVEMQKQLDRIRKRTESGLESDYKLAIIDADDFLAEVLDERGYDGKSVEESIRKAGKLIARILNDLLAAHEVRNSIVYDPNYKLVVDQAKKILNTYESAIKNIGTA